MHQRRGVQAEAGAEGQARQSRAEGAMQGVGCARLRRAGEGAGAGDTAERRGARAQGRERQGQRDSIADGTALRCGESR